MLKHEMLNILKTMQRENPEAFSDEKLFKAFSRDLLNNDAQYSAVIRWVCIAMFEHNAANLLKHGAAKGDIFIKHRLAANLIEEGARNNLAAEAIGYLAVLAGYEDRVIAEFINNKSYSAESSPADGIITFGGYQWKTLDEQNGMSLLLSEKIIERRAFNDVSAETAWSICTLNKYLNTEFYNNFSIEEQSCIISREIITEKNPWFDTTKSNASADKIFLLSLEEIVKYFGDSGQLHNPPTKKLFINDSDYNDRRIARDTNGQPIIWWLRSPGDTNRSAAVVMGNGHITPCGFDVSNPQGGVRPAMWVKSLYLEG
jgi:hypothetical protein